MTADRHDKKIPVNLITGFLGSGKTTLLQRLLEAPEAAGTAVIINEIGEISLDHILLEQVDGEVAVLKGGCICCTVRTDLGEAIISLNDKKDRGLIPPFDRVVIETTGLADPAPIVATLMLERVLRHRFRLSNVITTIDAVNIHRHLENNIEAVKQLAVADRILVTKTDLPDAETTERIEEVLYGVNPTAEIHDAQARPSAHKLLITDISNPETRMQEAQSWATRDTHHSTHAQNPSGAIKTLSIELDQPIGWNAFALWLTFIVQAHGENILRLKGILNIGGENLPIAIHGVQHTIHPPHHLEEWPSDDRRSKVVMIFRNLEATTLEKSLRTFLALEEPSVISREMQEAALASDKIPA